jgi:hypothetical protein
MLMLGGERVFMLGTQHTGHLRDKKRELTFCAVDPPQVAHDPSPLMAGGQRVRMLSPEYFDHAGENFRKV